MFRTKKWYIFVFLHIFWLVAANALQNSDSTVEQTTCDSCNISQETGTLLFSHVIHRTGERAPHISYAGDQHEDQWPLGLSQLPNLGKDQAYALGEWLRQRYNTFLNESYSLNEIYVRSSDIDRTLMSAQMVVAGLYPPKNNEIWNPRLLWQPIPIHSVLYNTDYITGGIDGADLPVCPSYDAAYSAYISSPKQKELDNSYQPIYDLISKKTGTIVNETNIRLYNDLLQSNSKSKKPKWSKCICGENLQQASLRNFYYPSATPFLAKFRTGFLLKEILERLKSKIENSLVPNRKLWIYSTHDTVLSNLLNSLKSFDYKFVPYSAAIILELRKIQNSHFVEIFYKNSTLEPMPINIPDCGTLCPLEKLYQIYGSILPKNDYDIECKIFEDNVE